jgi:hypothetical protein
MINDYWPYIVSGFCGIILLALISALIFRPAFRRDLIGGEGEAKLFDFVSVRGAIIVLLIGVFFAGLVLPVTSKKGNSAEDRDCSDLECAIKVIEKHVNKNTDSLLLEFGQSTLDDWTAGLRQLNQGQLTLKREYSGAQPAIEMLKKMKKGDTVLATHMAYADSDHLYAWENQPLLRRYFEENVLAVGRDVTIKRVFVVRKSDLYDESADCVRQEAVKLLESQEEKGIEVYVTWFENIANSEDAEDFIVFKPKKNLLLQINESRMDEGYTKTTLITSKNKVQIYRKKWDSLQNLGNRLKQVITEFQNNDGEVTYCNHAHS